MVKSCDIIYSLTDILPSRDTEINSSPVHGKKASQHTANYEIILFDADRTLYDFDRGEAFALESLMSDLGHPLTAEMFCRYRAINKELWDQFDRGQREKSTIAPTRFRRFFSEFGIGLDSDLAAAEYLNRLSEQRFLLPGAFELCQRLHGHFDMYIVTNGMGDVQTRRFSSSELAPLFKGIFISETLGAAKPSPEFYDRALALCQSPDKSRILAVGDSPAADILGANNAGIDACWFAPDGGELPEGIFAKYQVKTLAEIGDILMSEV